MNAFDAEIQDGVEKERIELDALSKEAQIGARESDRKWSYLWFRGNLVDSEHDGEHWVLLEVHRGICEAAFDALKESGVECKPHFSNPHISVLRPEETAELKKKYGSKWKGVAKIGQPMKFRITTLVNLVPQSWDKVDRVWFVECASPDLEEYRKDLGFSPLPKDRHKNHDMRFHITFAIHENTVKKASEELSPTNSPTEAITPPDHGKGILAAFNKMELDPEVTEATLKERHSNVSAPFLLRTTRKLLDINAGKDETDDRDSLAFQTLHGPEDFFAERIRRDAGQLGRRLLWKSTLRGHVQHIPSGALTPQLKSVFTRSGMASLPEESNPLDIYDQAHRVTRLGEGGIPSLESIPDEARAVQPSHMGFIDVIRSPESSRIGVDSRVAHGTFKGSDGQLYTTMINARTKKPELISAVQASKAVVAFPGEMEKEGDTIRAMAKARRVEYVKKNDVDYVLPSHTQIFNAVSNLTPMTGAIDGGRLLMGSRFVLQALPLKNPEAPLVQSLSETGRTFHEIMGEKAGALRAQDSGVVTDINPDSMTVRYLGGKKVTHELLNNVPYNRKTFTHNTPLVKIGDQVRKGQMLAKSNYTDDKGTLALGGNFRTAYMVHHGNTFEDAIVISESASKRLQSEHMIQNLFDPEDNKETGRKSFISMFPALYKKEQLGGIGEDGVIKKGSIIHQGDPLVLALERNKPSAVHRGHRPMFSDASITWDHSFDGEVVDTAKGKDGSWNVIVKAYAPMEEADKIVGSYGDKGVVSKILPDEQMPHDKDGKPLEVLLNPLGIISRGNPAQLYETLLGKVARKTGKPYRIPGFMQGSFREFVQSELQKNGLKDTEDLFDPVSNRKIPAIMTGERYLMKAMHTAEGKGRGRDIGGYTSEGLPARGGMGGSKTIGGMESSALIAHNALNVLRDAKVTRGQKNDDYWRAFKMGQTPPPPEVPMVYEKMLGFMKGAGINIKKDSGKLHLMALRDKDIEEMSHGEIGNSSTVKGDTLAEVPGGLFDRQITGGHQGCFHPLTTVLTENGPMPIGTIVNKRKKLRVWSYNFDQRCFELKPVVNWFKNYSKEGIGCSKFYSDGRLSCTKRRYNPETLWGTPTHQVYAVDGSKHDLSSRTSLLAIEEKLSWAQAQVIYGSLLGDGYAADGHYSERHAMDQEPYLRFKADVLGKLVSSYKTNLKHGSADSWTRQRVAELRTIAHRAIHEAESLVYINGVKTVSPEWLSRVNAFGLACWFMDDGSVCRHEGKNTIYISLATCAFTKAGIKMIQKWLYDRWQLKSFTSRPNKKYGRRNMGWSVCLAGSQAFKFLSLIFPFMESSWAKSPGPPATVACCRCGSQISPERKICNSCLIREARECCTHKIPQHIRRRLGGTAKVREIVAGLAYPPADDNPLGSAWKELSHTLGAAVPLVRNSTAMGFGLTSIACTWRQNSGAKWEKTKTVYDIEVEGNHNYVANGILVSNSNWSHISLAEPLPSPVFEDPIRNLLGLTKQQYENVISSHHVLGGETGSVAIQHALARINVDSAIHYNEDEIKNGVKSNRDDAVKRLAYLKALKKTGIKPEELMLSKVPVIPPSMRPITAFKKMTLTSDPNLLYRDLMKANEGLKQVKDILPPDKVGAERLMLYNSFKAVAGLGDPVQSKTQEKGVHGLLSHVFGEGSAKYGMMQRRVLGSPVDLVGRATIIPNEQLGMDQVGIPEEKAWTIYRPFIVRRLIRRGMAATQAALGVANRTDVAKKAMLEEMGERPVIINRAPTLHKYGFMAAFPVLTKGEAMQLPPVVEAGYGADHDGDQMNYHVPSSDDAVKDAIEKMLPSHNLHAVRDFKVHYLPRNEFLMGLHLGSNEDKHNEPRVFKDKKSALAAYHRGEVEVGDRILIK